MAPVDARILALEGLAETLVAGASDAVSGYEIAHGELTLTAPPAALFRAVQYLRDAPTAQFTSLIDICAVDYPERERRFELAYHFLSMPQNQRVRLKAALREAETAPSIVALHPSANWFEREVFDMHGVIFTDHPDLRRILTDYGFRGHPLRKDFPTTGYTELRYDEEAKRVAYEPVKLVQDYRNFDFMSPWEGARQASASRGEDKADG